MLDIEIFPCYYILEVIKMARLAREKSSTGIYHVMMRGIDKRDIFIVEEDYEKFLSYIEKAKEKRDFSIFAFCLMTNHVHLLIKEGDEEIGNTIRRINVGYAQYHNRRYGRTGHLFQNRYQSEPVEDDKYMLTVLRYIHQNPLVAGMVGSIDDYKWSSFKDYHKKRSSIVDCDYVMEYFSDVEEFKDFNSAKNDDECLEYKEPKIYTDEELLEVIKRFTGVGVVRNMEMKTRDGLIRAIKQETGASVRQLERVLGIGRSIIQKA